MESPGLQLLNDIRAEQKETALLIRAMVRKAAEDNELFKLFTARLNDLSERLKILEERDSP